MVLRVRKEDGSGRVKSEVSSSHASFLLQRSCVWRNYTHESLRLWFTLDQQQFDCSREPRTANRRRAQMRLKGAKMTQIWLRVQSGANMFSSGSSGPVRRVIDHLAEGRGADDTVVEHDSDRPDVGPHVHLRVIRFTVLVATT